MQDPNATTKHPDQALTLNESQALILNKSQTPFHKLSSNQSRLCASKYRQL